jgi:surfactin family lipopeptide synthetase A
MKKATDLSEARRALLDRYLRGNLAQSGSDLGVIPRRSSSGPAPLSFGQQQLWFLAQLTPDTPVYNESVTIRLPGVLDVSTLEKSLNAFIDRHEAWRTIFPLVDEEPVQVVLPAMPLELPVVDLRHHPESAREGEALRLATELAVAPFDLAHGPLLRSLLVHVSDDDHRLFMTLHHIIFDAVAVYQIFLPELHTLYEAFSQGKPSPLAPLPIQYTDFASWQRESQQKEDFARELTYWKEQLAGAPQVLELPADHPRPAVQSARGSMQTFALSRQLTDDLKALSSREGITLYMTLTAAFQTLLHRYTGQTDLVIGTVTSGRKRSELKNLVGYFLNTLVLRTHMDGDPTFRELLGHVREVVVSARRHEEVPFEYVVKELQPERSLSYTPLIQVMLSYQPALPELPAGWACSQMDVQTHTTKFDLSLELDERAEGLIGRFIYNTDLFEDATILRMIDHLKALLAGIVAHPGERIAQLPLLTQDECALCLSIGTPLRYPLHKKGACISLLRHRLSTRLMRWL